MDKFNSLVYRPDIDGLRAIAVISVILFHLEKKIVPGGFLGVDIFFVISGYLITFLIYGQIRNGSFRFSDFYRRRINRIFPALFVVIASVLILGLILLSPTDLTRLFEGAVAATAAVSNLYFWREYGNYFNSGVNEAPLLHTWSLGVEEQFYIIWPVILLWLARLKGRTMLIIIVLSLVATVITSEVGIRTATSASYYLLPTRFFELAIGSSLAIFIFHRGAPFKYRGSTICGIVGFILIFGSLFFLSEKTPFPGINALYPCIGAALLIASGANSQTFSARALSAKPLVLIGLISYSLYLWHWPLIAYTNYMGVQINLVFGTMICSASMILAWLSWNFVEIPFRRSGALLTFPVTALKRYMLPFFVLALLSFAVIGNGGLPSRFDPRVVEYEKIIGTAPEKLYEKCHSSTFFYQREPHPSCLLGSASKPVDSIFIGDSYANHFTGMVDLLAKQDDLTVMHYTMDGCLPVKGVGFGSIASYVEKCKSRNNFSYKFIASHNFKYVLLGASWPNNGTSEYFVRLHKGLEDSISSILSSGAKPIIILNNQGTKNANCPIRRLLTGSTENCEKAPEPNEKLWQMFQSLKREFPDIIYIDPNKVICEKTTCHSMIGNVPLYRDSGHLNDIGSRMIGKMLIAKGIRLTQGDASPSLFPSTEAATSD
ncbi:MAG: acetyltransferase [Spirosoma sp.]|nr:acetyltransferase [Spirosoma sp.]